MNIISRVKNILITPQTEWPVINTETETPQSLFFKYVIPLSLIPAVCMFIGYGFIGMGNAFFHVRGIQLGLIMGVNSFIGSILTYFICTYIVDAVGPSFSSPKNLGKSAQLVAYSYTAFWVVGICYLFPMLGILALLGLYSIYLFYVGVPVLKHTPEDKRVVFMLVCAGVIILVSLVIAGILSQVVFRFFGNPFL